MSYNCRDRRLIAGPPENSRDYIMGASKAMSIGEWQRARDFILSIKTWDILPDCASIKEMLTLYPSI